MTRKVCCSVLFICLLLSGCIDADQKSQLDRTPTIIAGKVLNRDYYPHIKTINLRIPDFPGNEIFHIIDIDQDGTFKLTFQPLVARDVSLYPLIQYVYVHPGDSIFITLDFKNILNVGFAGDASELNIKIHNFMTSEYSSFFDEAFEIGPEKYHHYCDSVRQLNFKKRDKIIRGDEVDKEFVEWTTKCINTQYFSKLTEYPLRYSHMNNTEWSFPNEYYEYINEIESVYASEPIYSGIFDFSSKFFEGYYGPKNFLDHILTKENIDSAVINKLASAYDQDKFNQYLISNFFHKYFAYNTLEVFEKHRSIYESRVTDPFLRESLERHYQKTKDYIDNPSILSNSILYGNEFEEPASLKFSDDRNLIDTIISNNKGKIVYVYFWTTWCPPCINDAPKFNTAMDKYKDKNIEWVFVCLGNKNDYDSVKQLFTGGKHYLCKPGEAKTLGKRLNFFNGIPYSLLINEDGDVVDFGSHVRPYKRHTINKIESLIN